MRFGHDKRAAGHTASAEALVFEQSKFLYFSVGVCHKYQQQDFSIKPQIEKTSYR